MNSSSSGHVKLLRLSAVIGQTVYFLVLLVNVNREHGFNIDGRIRVKSGLKWRAKRMVVVVAVVKTMPISSLFCLILLAIVSPLLPRKRYKQ